MMLCENCGGSYQKKSGSLFVNDKRIGSMLVNVDEYFECKQCKEKLFPFESAEIIDKQIKEQLDTILRSYPVCDFVTSSEAAGILGITRQAFHKNKRIRNGFIHQIEVSGKKLYLRKSVESYKEVGDGRIPVSQKWTERMNVGDGIAFSKPEIFPYDIVYPERTGLRRKRGQKIYNEMLNIGGGGNHVYH